MKIAQREEILETIGGIEPMFGDSYQENFDNDLKRFETKSM